MSETLEEENPNRLRGLRAAVDGIRFKVRIAQGGSVLGAVLLFNSSDFSGFSPMFATVLSWAGPVVALAGFVPFLLAKCPKCKGRFNAFANIMRSLDGPLPCASCGFDPNAHLPRYGRT